MLLALAVGAFVLSRVFGGNRESPASYYRITTDLETEGQPFQLDVVVQCRDIEVLRSGSGGRLSYRQVPYLYGQPTPAGHAVLMRVPDYCGLLSSGDERNKAAAQRLKEKMALPLVLWMPDKDDPDRMTAYTSPKGYESPGSTLRYVGTRLSDATREDWQAWMKSAGQPFIRRANDPFLAWDENGVQKTTNRLPLECNGLLLLPIPASLQEEVRRAWPEGKPLAWADAALWDRIRQEFFRLLAHHPSFRDSMYFLGRLDEGVDVIPYDGRSVRAETDPLASAYRPQSYVTIKRVDLDTPVRGRAECLRGSSTYANIWIFQQGDRSARLDRVSSIYINDNQTLGSRESVGVFEGSHEGMLP